MSFWFWKKPKSEAFLEPPRPEPPKKEEAKVKRFKSKWPALGPKPGPMLVGDKVVEAKKVTCANGYQFWSYWYKPPYPVDPTYDRQRAQEKE